MSTQEPKFKDVMESLIPKSTIGPQTFEELVGVCIGRASVCWSELPKGVFDSAEAKKLVDEIVDWHGHEMNNSANYHCPEFLSNESGTVSCHKDFQAENNLLRAAFDNADRMIRGQQEWILRLNAVLKEADAVIEEYYNHDDGSPLFRYKGLHDTQKKIRGVLE